MCLISGLESELRELCTSLLGPVVNTGAKSTWENSVLVRLSFTTEFIFILFKLETFTDNFQY